MNRSQSGDPFSPAAVLVTGGAGFIGSNLIRWMLKHAPDMQVVNLDLLTYAGNLESLTDVAIAHDTRGSGRYYFVHGDIRDASLVESILDGSAIETVSGRTVPPIDAVLHLAAESHVDRSILGSAQFVSTNVVGTHTLLECVRTDLSRKPREFRFVNVSTDEVYGSLGPSEPAFTEKNPIAPNSPYSASKAAADCLVRAYWETYQLPAITTRCSNNYGPFQFPEKLIPLMITKAIEHAPLPVYGDGLNVRDWIHVEDHAAGIWRALSNGRPGQVYNFGGESETTNLALVNLLLAELKRPESLIRFVEDRLGHDRRYAVDISKGWNELGWRPSRTLYDGIQETVRWYVSNDHWWKRVLNEAYRAAEVLYPLPSTPQTHGPSAVPL